MTVSPALLSVTALAWASVLTLEPEPASPAKEIGSLGHPDAGARGTSRYVASSSTFFDFCEFRSKYLRLV